MNDFEIRKLGLLYALQAEMEGMKADNKQREIEGLSMPYTSGDFENIASQMRDVINDYTSHSNFIG